MLLVDSALKLVTSGLSLTETILKGKTPSEAKKLGELKLELVKCITDRNKEIQKEDPNDELIENLYKKEEELCGKIAIYQDLAIAQLTNINS